SLITTPFAVVTQGRSLAPLWKMPISSMDLVLRYACRSAELPLNSPCLCKASVGSFETEGTPFGISPRTQGFEDLGGMLFRARPPGPVLLHLAVRADPHGRADHADHLLAVHHLLAVGSVLLHHLAVGVGEQRERQ